MKTYVKPDLYYEDFDLTGVVATGCTDIMGHSENSCSIDLDKMAMPGTTLFHSEVCMIDSEAFEQYCYYTGSELFNIFTS